MLPDAMTPGTDPAAARQLLFWGSLLLCFCFVFYLAWWLLAFRPSLTVSRAKYGWLLIPAFLLGILSLVLILMGASRLPVGAGSLFSGGTVLIAAVVAYLALLLFTSLALHRQVTTELFLIVGWTALVFWEGNALCGLGILSQGGTAALCATASVAALVSLICYLLFYHLKDWEAYVDGTIPLVLSAGFMAFLSILIARSRP